MRKRRKRSAEEWATRLSFCATCPNGDKDGDCTINLAYDYRCQRWRAYRRMVRRILRAERRGKP